MVLGYDNVGTSWESPDSICGRGIFSAQGQRGITCPGIFVTYLVGVLVVRKRCQLIVVVPIGIISQVIDDLMVLVVSGNWWHGSDSEAAWGAMCGQPAWCVMVKLGVVSGR